MSSKPVFLEVDSSIREKKYMIRQESEEDEIGKFFGPSASGQLPPKLVKPQPGFCIKTKEKPSGKKLFINICHTEAIPAPRDISESELIEILDTDEICDYRIPMSIGDLRTEPDKKGDDASVCDVAINPKFFEKIKNNQTFKEFFIAVACEGLKEKYKLETQDEKIVLQNKKAHGSLQVHRIQQREVNRKMGLDETLPSVDDILHKNDAGKSKIIEVLSDKVSNTPDYRLFKKVDDEDTLYAEVYLPYMTSSRDLSLDIGEDRIILESTKGTYFLDTYHNQLVEQNRCSCVFNKDSKFLTVTMPIKSC